MTFPVRLVRKAQQDLDRAAEWYDGEREGLGDDFREAVIRRLLQVGRFPLSCPIAVRDLRRLTVGSFPYCVYYRIVRNEISVVAILHAKRNPGNWP